MQPNFQFNEKQTNNYLLIYRLSNNDTHTTQVKAIDLMDLTLKNELIINKLMVKYKLKYSQITLLQITLYN